jgi:hypothetical protein
MNFITEKIGKHVTGVPPFPMHGHFVRDHCAYCDHMKRWSKRDFFCNFKRDGSVPIIPKWAKNREWAGFDFCPCKAK